MRWLRSMVAVATCALAVACGGGNDVAANDAGGIPDVSADGVPDVADGTESGQQADLRELASYRLTMEDVRAWAAATHNLEAVAQRYLAEHPEAAEQADDEEVSADASLDDLEAYYDRIPGAREAVEDAGLSVHRFALIGNAVLQAGMADYAVQQGADPKDLAAKAGIHPDNIAFAAEHRAELAQLRSGG